MISLLKYIKNLKLIKWNKVYLNKKKKKKKKKKLSPFHKNSNC